MISDAVRRRAYTEALQAVVRPGAVVVDIGTGPGWAAVVACKLGAARIYAIEPNPVIQAARLLAEANNCAAQITFLQGFSDNIDLPEKVDVIVSDMRGVLPLYSQHIPALIDARTRFLNPSGTLIPFRDTVFAAPIENARLFAENITPEPDGNPQLDFSPLSRHAANLWCKARFQPEHLLASAKAMAVLDYHTITNPNVRSTLQWVSERSGTTHGLAVWFDAELIQGIGFSNAPGAPKAIYGNAFFPFESPVQVSEGDQISVEIDATLVGEDYVWRWNTKILTADGTPKASFRQSTFYGEALSPQLLSKAAPNHRPQLSEEGGADLLVLRLMSEKHSLAEIAERLQSSFPKRFPTPSTALTHATRLAARYGS